MNRMEAVLSLYWYYIGAVTWESYNSKGSLHVGIAEKA